MPDVIGVRRPIGVLFRIDARLVGVLQGNDRGFDFIPITCVIFRIIGTVIALQSCNVVQSHFSSFKQLAVYL